MKLSTFMAPLRALYSLLFLLVTLNVFGQVSTGYTFSEDNVTYSELTGATTIFSSGWNDNIPATGLPSSAFTINVVGNTLAAGILNQWQIAENAAGPWTDISGATTENLTN